MLGSSAGESVRCKAVVIAAVLLGSNIAIAEIVEAPEHTVRSRLRDGRKDLSRALADDSYFGDQSCADSGDGR